MVAGLQRFSCVGSNVLCYMTFVAGNVMAQAAVETLCSVLATNCHQLRCTVCICRTYTNVYGPFKRVPATPMSPVLEVLLQVAGFS